MGRIPVFLYNDLPWIAYQGSNISIETYGFSAGLTSTHNDLKEMVHVLKNITTEDYNRKLVHLKNVRQYFTYAGVFHQLDEFLRDPFGPNGGHLRCVKHPHTERCCGR